MSSRGLSGQSAVEYLMTYGWMLLVVAIVGGAVFSVVQQQDVESVSGFSGSDVLVDDFGTTSEGELQLVLRNGGAEEVELNEVRVSDGEKEAVWKPSDDRSEIDVSGTQVSTFLQVQEGNEANNLDVELNYDQRGLSNLKSEGVVSGSFDVVEGTEFYDMDPLVLHVNSTRPGDSNDTQFEIGTGGGNFNYQVQWENLDDGSEGEIIDPLTGDHTLDFDSPGMHRVEIRGLFPHPRFYDADPKKIESLEAWGDIEYRNMNSMFRGVSNLEAGYSDSPDTSNVQNMIDMFRGASSFNGSVSGWSTSEVITMREMFRGASSFEGKGINEWDTGNVESMRLMFRGASSFNGSVGSWDTGSVTDMRGTFRGVSSFDFDLGDWDTGNVKRMDEMFRDASNFEGRGVEQWDTGNVESMRALFFGASSFNGSVGSWNTADVETTRNMFRGADSFDRDISSWNTSKISNMKNMFYNSDSFDRDISSWCVELIDQEPNGFGVSEGNQPDWGETC